jgi:threonine/homoserine/homoserine lactone efflux protein
MAGSPARDGAYRGVMLLALGAFTIAAVLIILLPGPDTLVTIRSLVRGGRSAGSATAAGILVGLTIWVGIAALGLAAVLRASEVAYAVLRVVGACYLVWLGVQSLRAVRRPTPAAAPDDSRRRGLVGTGFSAGLVTNLLNPKVGVFYVALLPQFLPPGSDPLAVGLLLAGVHALLSVIWFALLILLASVLGRWLRRPGTVRGIDAVTGTTLVGFGVKLAVSP